MIEDKDPNLLPKWMMKRYLILRKELGFKQASFDDIYKVLHSFFKDNEKVVRIFLSELRKAGWVLVDFDPKDNRKRLYQFKKSEEMFDKVIEDVYAKKVATRK